ncbi:hypothetical protein H8356DRAFT_1348357 [Neocallimastix lanati (nom. inval.)]|nr:hypothetical protein H8356DRAFT_1348357 [Neocallimastix sp. JGI-2020a]
MVITVDMMIYDVPVQRRRSQHEVTFFPSELEPLTPLVGVIIDVLEFARRPTRIKLAWDIIKVSANRKPFGFHCGCMIPQDRKPQCLFCSDQLDQHDLKTKDKELADLNVEFIVMRFPTNEIKRRSISGYIFALGNTLSTTEAKFSNNKPCKDIAEIENKKGRLFQDPSSNNVPISSWKCRKCQCWNNDK